MAQTIKIDIISGFLGAGKTTLINKLLKEAYIGEKIALLENEFGEIAIDGAFFDGHDITVKEIANGCICCTLQGSFVKGIVELVQKYTPDRIIIEPTGIGRLKDIVFACTEAAKETNIAINCMITVVDATMYPIFIEISGEFYQRQISDGRTIVLSAVQNLSESDNLCGIIDGIRALNPLAPIFAKPWAEMDGLELLQVAEETGLDHRQDFSHEHDHDHSHDHHHDNEGFQSCSLETDKVWTEQEIRDMMQKLARRTYGQVFRAKGFLKTAAGMVKVDYVYGRSEIVPSPYTGPGKFVTIGKDIAGNMVEKLFAGETAAKNYLMLACPILQDEIRAAAAETEVKFPILFIPSDLHLLPDKLRDYLQEMIDRLENVDCLLLPMGRCGNGTLGLKSDKMTIILPKCEDCINLTLSDEKLMVERPVYSYFLTAGWLREKNAINNEYDATLKKYGPERAAMIMGMMYANTVILR
ncbi:GTP-binding protein [Candidatus Formimonas warabiya]|uniref:CobW C-terminal domain-containing protein n=1 Tax=Formimonas warabiya TaxID=1761012 RepID=A0A3G1KMX9_FORW1|nr:GTP-binding protein [Candidatus Formimonas warabiya]ATW23807.1 hypothetical protein DCMF_02455 [Candidatus Formimonas warabiya]